MDKVCDHNRHCLTWLSLLAMRCSEFRVQMVGSAAETLVVASLRHPLRRAVLVSRLAAAYFPRAIAIPA